MELRKEIEPDFVFAENIYPDILKNIETYIEYVDKNGDEDNVEYEKLEKKLHEMIGKNMTQFDLWESWEANGTEVLAFEISLPDPKITLNITKDELTEIIHRMKSQNDMNLIEGDFKSIFYINTVYSNGYYAKFLALNFPKYDVKLFNRNKDKQGNYFEYTINEIIERLWK